MTTKRKTQRFIQCDATLCRTSFAPKLTFPCVCSPKPTLTLSGKSDNDKGPDPTRQSLLFSRFQPSRTRRNIKTTQKHSASFNSTRPCAASVLLPSYRSNALQVITATGAVTRIPIQRFLLRHTVPQRCIFHVGPWLRQASPKGQMTDNFRHIFSERKSTSHHRRLFHHQNPIFFIAHVSWCTRCQYLTVSHLSSIAVTIGSSGFGRIGRPVLQFARSIDCSTIRCTERVSGHRRLQVAHLPRDGPSHTGYAVTACVRSEKRKSSPDLETGTHGSWAGVFQSVLDRTLSLCKLSFACCAS